MNNVYIIKKLISNETTGELDFDFQKEFGFDSEIQDSLEEIRQGGAGYADGYPIRLDVLIGMLQKLKDQGCTHTEVDYNCDHFSYEISGYEIRLATPHEIDNFVHGKVNKEKARKMERLDKLKKEVERLREEVK